MKAINKSTNNERKQYGKRENTPLYRLFHSKGRGWQNHLYRAGGELPLLPQRRDAEQVGADEDYKRMAYELFTRLGKKAYPVLCSSPEKAIVTADEYVATAGHVPDIVFFDLPGTVNSEGVINSLAGMDYIFTPISADKVVLESSLSFAMAIQKLLVKNEACRLAGLYLFGNMVDGREKNRVGKGNFTLSLSQNRT